MYNHYPLQKGYLRAFNYFDAANLNEQMLAIDDPESNALRSITRDCTDAVTRECIPTFEEFRNRFMSATDQSDQVGLAFRGQAYPWPLQTKLKRFWDQVQSTVQLMHVQESDILDYVMHNMLFQDGKVLSPFSDQLWVILQHYGMPTPLLDWTLNPDVALYFAFADSPAYEARNVILYIADMGKMHIMNHRCRYGDNATLVAEQLKDWEYLDEYENTWSFVCPHIFTDIRLSVQQGVFALQRFGYRDDRLSLGTYLTKPLPPLRRHMTHNPIPGTLHVLTIPVSERPVVMSYLERKGICRGSLFPSWEGVCTDALSAYRDMLLTPNQWEQFACGMNTVERLTQTQVGDEK